MKRQIFKGLATLCASVMTLFAASSLFVSCKYDDTILKEQIEELGNQLDALDARVKAIEDLKTKLESLTARVDALYTLKFQVSDANELQYSFDGGQTWTGTGIMLADECDKEFAYKAEGNKFYFSTDGGKTWVETDVPVVDPCACPEVALVDNGDYVTIKVGNASFDIAKPEEIVFEIQAGKVYFESQATQLIGVKTAGIEDVTVMAAPKGWYAEIDADGYLSVTAPDYETTQGTLDYETWTEIPGENAASGYVKVHACSEAGKCMVGRLLVEVSMNQVVVSAYGGNYTVASTDSWDQVYFGASKKADYEADAKVLLEAFASEDYDVVDAWENVAQAADYGEQVYATGKLEDILGYEPVVGEEYVVWAYSIYSDSYDLSELVLAYYTPVVVTAVEDEAKKTAFDVYVSLEVEGTALYYAVAIPGSVLGWTTIDYYVEEMALSIQNGSGLGKLFNENYEGSLYQICEGTGYYMGAGSPNEDVYLLVLPVDGRPAEAYTTADVKKFDFKTKALEAGGAVTATVAQVFEDVDWSGAPVALDPYSEIGVELTPNSTDWAYVYFNWLTPEEYTSLADDKAIVDYVLASETMRSASPRDFENPVVKSGLSPAETIHFVAFYVGEDGKYGEVVKGEYTTETLTYSDITIDVEDNLNKGILKNTNVLELTITPTEPASKYRYIKILAGYYNQYEGKTEAEMADILFFMSYNYTDVAAEDLVDGVLKISDNDYNNSYYMAILPYDAEGNPGKEAVIIEYDCKFAMESVITDNLVSVPTVTVSDPVHCKTKKEYEEVDANYFYAEENEDWYGNISKYFYYNTEYTVVPAEGTTVRTLLSEAYEIEGMDALAKAEGLWGGSLNSWHTKETTTEATFNRTFNGDEFDALEVVILISWVDAEGNYYYKEMDLSAEYLEMFTTLGGIVATE